MAEDYYAQVSAAFDRAAESYRADYAGNPVMAWLAGDTFARLCALFPAGSRVLEIGCGPGEMALRMAAAGREIIATDISPAMIEAARSHAAGRPGAARVTWRAVAAGQLEEAATGRIDGAYSNFGPLNCEPELDALARTLARLLPPGAAFLCSVMNRWCAWELALGFARLRPREGTRRLGQGWRAARMSAAAGEAASEIAVRYFSPGEFARLFRPYFRLETCLGYPVVIPPPYTAARWPNAARRLGGIERRIRAWPGPLARRSLPPRPEANGRNRDPSMNIREIGCPLCCGPLAIYGETLRCPVHRLNFPRHPSGFLDLRPPDLRAAGDAFAADYRAARLAEGIEPLTPEAARALPEGSPRGYPRLYWQVRRESWAALREVLRRQPSSLTVADLGAGVPWLSHRLAAMGHRVVAVDLSPDADFGLGAARHFPDVAEYGGPAERERFSELAAGRFLPVLGSLEQPPLAPCAFDAVVCNASLHYAADLPDAVKRIARALRPGAALLIMDSPVGALPRPGIGAGRVLGREEVEAALRGAGLRVTFHPIKRSLLWRRRQLKNRLLKRVVFEFPLVEARANG